VVSTTPRPLYPPERPGTDCTGDWVGSRAGLDVCENSRPTGIRSPDRPARSQSLYRLSYPNHNAVGKLYSLLLSKVLKLWLLYIPHTLTLNILYLVHTVCLLNSRDVQNKHLLGKVVNQLDATQKELYSVFLDQHVSGISMSSSVEYSV
jgi:hypothetical protein